MVRWLVAALLSLAPAALAAQPEPPQAETAQEAELWIETPTRITSRRAGAGFPRVAGTISYASAQEFSRPGEGMDAALQYRSDDGEVFGTVYIYHPGLSHPGIAAYATENAIRLTSPSPVRVESSRLVQAGKLPEGAVRTDFSNFRGSNVSSAAFLKAGRWTLKIRVTGPETRASEVSQAMDALLEGVEFGSRAPHLPARLVKVGDCPSESRQREAKRLPDPGEPDILAHIILATLDGGGYEVPSGAGDQKISSRVPSEFCLSSTAQIGQVRLPILRSAPRVENSIEGRTRLIAILTDSGWWLEVVESAKLGRHWLLVHEIGATSLLASYDDVPSDRQIAEVVDQYLRKRLRIPGMVLFVPGREPEIKIAPSDPGRIAMRAP